MRNSAEMKKQGALCGLSLAQRGIKHLPSCSLSVVGDRTLGRSEQCDLKVLPPNLASPLLSSSPPFSSPSSPSSIVNRAFGAVTGPRDRILEMDGQIPQRDQRTWDVLVALPPYCRPS